MIARMTGRVGLFWDRALIRVGEGGVGRDASIRIGR